MKILDKNEQRNITGGCESSSVRCVDRGTYWDCVFNGTWVCILKDDGNVVILD
jgi:hypothetical protein